MNPATGPSPAHDPGPSQSSAGCPVPPEQRPLEEYRQLCRSWFFRWPTGDLASLLRPLLIAWLLTLPLTLLVASGSLPLRQQSLRLVAVGLVMALLVPLLLLLRQWLGWGYVLRRLQAERISYEESGWYDGQEWLKPPSWRDQDLLVATHQVAPLRQRLGRGLLLTVTLLLVGSGLCQAL
ncbi:MAG: CGLD27 family protein [Synechococcaceae cyanobacterium]|nr:CGLD27 family protein [Synechococcaceae cyanobacterium]